MKGESVGNVGPAFQANTPNGTNLITITLSILNQLFQHIIPKSISKVEMKLFNFHHNVNNTLSVGRLNSNGTSCQFNVSSHKKYLSQQSSLHTDLSDDPTVFTMFVLLINGGTGKPNVKPSSS
jgi:hypothetical protein